MGNNVLMFLFTNFVSKSLFLVKLHPLRIIHTCIAEILIILVPLPFVSQCRRKTKKRKKKCSFWAMTTILNSKMNRIVKTCMRWNINYGSTKFCDYFLV